MVIDERRYPLLGVGAYSHVYNVNGKAHKIFLNGPNIPPKQSFEGRKLVFQSQRTVLERVTESHVLEPHFPTFFGTCEVEKVLDSGGTDISNRFHLDCCLIMEQLDTNQEEKLYKQPSNFWSSELTAFVNLCNLHGFEYLDASVFNRNDHRGFKLIDVEMKGWVCR